MKALAYIVPSLSRNPRRTAAYLIGTVIAVGLLSSVLLFVAGAAQVLTQRSIATVRPDMQAVVTNPRADVTALSSALARQPGIASAQRFAIAGFSASQIQAGTRIGQTGSGKLVAIDPSYFSAFSAPVIRQGAFRPGGIVISQDLGTNLGARVGDTITVRFAHGVPPQRLRVIGVASMLNTDLLFAPLDPILRLNPFNPPANVILMDYGTFEQTLKPVLLQHAPPASSNGLVQRAHSPVVEQIHLRLNRTQIPADPAQAKVYTTNLRHRIELAYPGRLTILDNVAAALDNAQADVLWAQVIFVFLALPGVILAAALSRYVTTTIIDAQRRELALLRIRGIGPKQLLTLLGVALFLVALLGVLLGLGAGWATSQLVGGAGALSAGPLLLHTILLALGAGLLLGLIGTFWPLIGFIRAPITEARRRVDRGTAPFWARLYLDMLALVVGVLVYYLTQRNGFQPVLNAEGNPTISLSFFTFLGPLLFWVGAVLLLVRLSRWFTGRTGRGRAHAAGPQGSSAGRPGRRARLEGTGGSSLRQAEKSAAGSSSSDRGGVGGRFGVVGTLAGRTLSRRSGTLHQAVVLVAMAVAFSTGLAAFVQTYNQQQRIDAELTLGSDVKVSVVDHTRSPAVAGHLQVPGVSAVTPFRSTVAYVGAEIQDMFGIDVPSFKQATRLADSFFVGSTAAQTFARLQSTPNGIVVSAETARDYSLNMGDSLLLRMADHRTGRYVPVHFRLVGVAREFATAPKDAFLVANLAYIQAAIHDGGVDAFLVKTTGQPGSGYGSPASVASALQRQFAAGPAVHVQDLGSVQQQLATSLTSFDLTALSRIDYLYTLAIVLTCLLVFALAVLLERGRDFAVLEVLGTTPNQIRELLAIEIGYAVVTGAVLGYAVGLIFAEMLVQILTSIFDPPPDALAIPWSSFSLILVLVLASGVVAWSVATIRLGRASLTAALREA